MSEIMDGRNLSEEIKEKVSREVENLKQFGIAVGLGLLQVGENPASKQYMQATLKASRNVGMKSYQYNLSEEISINEILNTVMAINRDERINGLLVLLPLPKRINVRRVINEIAPEKDVDGLGSLSVGRLASDESTFQIFRPGSYESLYRRESFPVVSGFLPCTPFGVIRLIEYHGIKIKGKHAVVVGKSLAVGKPLSLMLLAKEATVTICHRETRELEYYTRQADILCSATGKQGLIKGDMVKQEAVVVDIGINVLNNGSIVGDIDCVGPVTIAMLLENTVRSAQSNQFLKHPLMIG
jgi:methylenetetrahydrofolate dehydrogenase (NADP+)/methenyltetrahydrofolate cyclohydrolase